jgi:cell division protein FtsQ
MARSLIARLGRPLTAGAAVRGSRARAGGSSVLGGRFAWRPLALVWRRARLRMAVLCGAAALVLCGAGWLWLRSSPLLAVHSVRISGVHGVDAGRVDAALSRAARGMTTLDVNIGALRAAVAPLHIVRDLHVSTSFPHTLRISVTEQPPVAELQVAGVRTAVAADGVVLGPTLLVQSLPSIDVGGLAPPTGGHVEGTSLRGELRVLGAVPAVLLGWVRHVFMGSEGLTVTMRTGLDIYFGNATRAHAKWLSAARVLADSGSAGATYIDVRLPERPAAGSSAPGGLTAGSSGTGQVSASDPTAAALAATLEEAVSGGSSGAAASSAVPAATTPGAATAPATGASEPAAAATAASEAGTAAAATSGEAATSSAAAPSGTAVTPGAAGSTGAQGESSAPPAAAPTGAGETSPTEQSTSTSG